jgi:hypothetical protein
MPGPSPIAACNHTARVTPILGAMLAFLAAMGSVSKALYHFVTAHLDLHSSYW